MFAKIVRSAWRSQIRFYANAKVEIYNEQSPIAEIGNLIHMKPERLAVAFKKNEKLHRTHSIHWKHLFSTLRNQGFKPEICLNMVTAYPELLYKKENDLVAGIESWRNCQFGESAVIHLLSLHPQFIDLPKNTIYERTSNLGAILSSRIKVKQLLELNPNTMYTKWSQITESIDYILNVMRIEAVELYKSSALQLSLSELKCRHTFLVRLGLFKPRNPKASPLDPSTNPKLHQITDTDDGAFARHVCTVTLEEFRVFQQLYEREERRNDVDFDSDDD